VGKVGSCLHLFHKLGQLSGGVGVADGNVTVGCLALRDLRPTGTGKRGQRRRPEYHSAVICHLLVLRPGFAYLRTNLRRCHGRYHEYGIVPGIRTGVPPVRGVFKRIKQFARRDDAHRNLQAERCFHQFFATFPRSSFIQSTVKNNVSAVNVCYDIGKSPLLKSGF